MKRRLVQALILLAMALSIGRVMALSAAQSAPAVPPPELAFAYHEEWWSTGSYEAEASSKRTTAGDFNGDGLDDVAMLHRTDGTTARFYVIPGAGDHFGSHTVWLTLNLDADIMTGRVAAGDFNNDGNDDVAAFAKVTADDSTRLYVFTSNGSGFETAIWWVGSLDYSDKIMGRVVAGDFDGDGRADDIVALYDASGDGEDENPEGDTIRADVFLSDGSDFTYQEDWWSRDRFAAANAQYRTVAGDVDADSDDDVVMVFDAGAAGGNETDVYVLLAGEGTFIFANWWESDSYIAGRATGRVAAGDFDGDGDDDVTLLYDYGPEGRGTRGHVLLSTRAAFSYQSSDGWWDGTGYDASRVTDRVVAGDWDGDGVDDAGMIYRVSSSVARADVLEATAPAPEPPTTRQVDGDSPACSDAAGAPYCTIQAAVDAAGDGDTIQLAGGGYSELVSAPKYDDPGFNQSLTIEGAGASSTFVDGGNDGTVFTVHAGGKVTLSRLTIRNGNGADGRGGGIYNGGGVVMVSDSVLDSNLAGISGGGLFNDGGTVTISDSTLTENSAHAGGGLANSHGRATVSGSIFSANLATSCCGGGIFNGGSSLLTVTDSTFSSNQANVAGGAIINAVPASVTATSSTFIGNMADDGGAILNREGGLLVVEGSTFYDNLAQDLGGGISNGGTLTVSNSTFSSNSASGGGGGGIYSDDALMVNSSTFSGNEAGAGGFGGGIFAEGTATIENSVVANSAAGFDCAGSATWNSAGAPNMDSDGTCPSFTLTGNPLLGPLADNGGATRTHALLDGSPAIDAGSNAACPETDQRGIPRPQDGDGDGAAVCDLGAFEYGQLTQYLPFVAAP